MRLAIFDDRPSGREIIFIEEDADPHIEKIAQCGARISCGSDFRDPARHKVFKIQYAALHQSAGEQPQHGLRNRHKNVRRVGAHAVVIKFIDDPAISHYHERIGIGRAQERFETVNTAAGLDRESSKESGVALDNFLTLSGSFGMSAVGMISRTCWKDHLLKGGLRQFASVTCSSAGGRESLHQRFLHDVISWRMYIPRLDSFCFRLPLRVVSGAA